MYTRTVLLLIQQHPTYKRKCQLEYLVLQWLEKRKKRITYSHTSLSLKWYRSTKLENFKRYYKFFLKLLLLPQLKESKRDHSSMQTRWCMKSTGGPRHCRQQLLCHPYSLSSATGWRLTYKGELFVLMLKGLLPNMLDTNLFEYIFLILNYILNGSRHKLLRNQWVFVLKT